MTTITERKGTAVITVHGSSRRRLRRTTALLALAALVAAGCGNSDDDDTAVDDTVVETTTTPAATDGTDAADDASTTTSGDATGTTAPADDAGADDELDVFVPIEGVPGVTDEQISFTAIGTNSNNPLGTCILDCYVDGIEAYFEWRNAQGGIYGRELVLGNTLDDELANNLPRAQEVVSSDGTFGAFVATLVASGFATLDDAGVPTFVWSIHATETVGRESIFGYSAVACATCPSRAIAYLMQQAGVQRAGVLGYGVSENSKTCANTTAAGIEQYAADAGGLEVVYLNDNLAFGLPNGIGPEVTAMRDAGVEFITTCMDLNGMRTLAEELARQGMDDVILHHPNTYNQQFVADNAALFEGDLVIPAILAFEAAADNAAAQAFLETMEARGATPSELAMIGWLNADLAYEALAAAGPEFDRASVIESANAELTAWSGGGLAVPVDWSRQHNPPTPEDRVTNGYANECFNVVQVVDGAFVPVFAEPDAPWICWPSDDRSFDAVEFLAFE